MEQEPVGVEQGAQHENRHISIDMTPRPLVHQICVDKNDEIACTFPGYDHCVSTLEELEH